MGTGSSPRDRIRHGAPVTDPVLSQGRAETRDPWVLPAVASTSASRDPR